MWLGEDIDAALEWIDYQASLCPGCGNPRTECMDETNEDAYQAVPLHCFACATRDAEQRAINQARSNEQMGDGSFDGLMIAVTERGHG